ncbi:MAG: acylphosphatase, partial [Atopobiaceae bacterium]|nr:acylphosphatase [Atopobiaceae bacterium]
MTGSHPEVPRGDALASGLVTRRIRVYGIVQGVGFRPTVARHATSAGVCGSVCNKGPYVEVVAQGTEAQVGRFLHLLEHEPPRRASILKLDVKPVGDAPSLSDFEIVESEKVTGEIF